MRIKLSFYLLLGVFAVQAHAGQDRGGGNAVVCFSDKSIPKNIARENNRPILDSELSKITSIELLDVYQERLKTDIEGNVNRLLEPKASETPREFANRLIHRIEHVSVNYYDELSDTMEDLFDRDLIQMAPYGIDQYKDIVELPIIDKQHCVLATMAKVMDSDSPEKSVFLIDSRLYNHRLHSKQSKAALLLHETIYRVARKFSHATNSDASRRGVGLFLRQKLMAGEFNQKILDLGLADDFFKGELPADELTALSLGMPSRLDMHSLAKQSQFNTCVWADTVEAYSLWINWSSDPHANRPCTNEDRANVITQLLDYFDSNYSFEQLQGLRSYLSDSQIKEFISVIRKRIANNMDADGHELISTITRQAYLGRRGQVTPQLPESYTKGSVFWMDILAFKYRLATDAELNAIRDLNQISI